MLSKLSCTGARALSRRALTCAASKRFNVQASCNQMAIRSLTTATTTQHQSPTDIENLTRVQHALLEALISCSSEPLSSCRRDAIAHELQGLPIEICPKKLEEISEDHTLVIPTEAFRSEDVCFESLLEKTVGVRELDEDSADCFWRTFATFYHSPRVIRCNDTDSVSTIQESNVLWPH